MFQISMASVNQKEVYEIHKATAHDWEDEKRNQKDFYDEGNLSFFW